MVTTPTLSLLAGELEILVDDVRRLSKSEENDKVSENCHFREVCEAVFVGMDVSKQSKDTS